MREVKEEMYYVALDFNEEMTEARISSAMEKNCELPDGSTLTIRRDERFRAP